MNGRKARLIDIQLLLAEANVGQRSYSVVGQGMVDHVLVSSPQERKEFFDDATGVKQFQIKRHQSMNKLKRSLTNLEQAELVLQEITPRMRILKRQINRLEQREKVETELKDLQTKYYGTLWAALTKNLGEQKKEFEKFDNQTKEKQTIVQGLQNQMKELEDEDIAQGTEDTGLIRLQNQYKKLQGRRSKFRDQEFQLTKEIELNKVKTAQVWTPLPLSKIITELEAMHRLQKKLLGEVKSIKTLNELEAVQKSISTLEHQTSELVKRLQRPAPEDNEKTSKSKNLEIQKKLDDIRLQIESIEGQSRDVEQQMKD